MEERATLTDLLKLIFSFGIGILVFVLVIICLCKGLPVPEYMIGLLGMVVGYWIK